jgi:hypothetical protein
VAPDDPPRRPTPFRPPAGEYPFGRARASFSLNAERRPARGAWGPPVVAYGANGSPEVMARKLPGAPVIAFAGTLHGWAVVHSAHVSPYGAVPATILPAPDERVDVHAIFVPADALEALDATELNYDRVHLDGGRLELPDADPGAGDRPMAYVSRHGPLLVDGEPVPLGARPQRELLELLKAA